MRALTDQEIQEFEKLLPDIDVAHVTHAELINRIDQIENLQAKLKQERHSISELIDRKRNTYPKRHE